MGEKEFPNLGHIERRWLPIQRACVSFADGGAAAGRPMGVLVLWSLWPFARPLRASPLPARARMAGIAR